MKRLISLSVAASATLLAKTYNGIVFAEDDPKNQAKLVAIQMITRHGARTPLALIPGIEEAEYSPDLVEPIIKSKFKLKPIGQSKIDGEYSYIDKNNDKQLKGGAPFGLLTKIGEEQMFNLGQRLRDKYVIKYKFLSSEYNSNEIYVRSTYFSRTIRTAKCVLAGLFNCPSNDDKNEFLIKVHDHAQDWLFPNTLNCALLRNFDRNIHEFLFNSNDEFRKYLKEMNEHLGIPNDKKIKFTTFRDDLVARIAHNHDIPKELHKFMLNADRLAAMELLTLYGSNTKMTCGLFINLIKKNLLKSIENDIGISENKELNENYKMIYYSAHDSTIAALLSALNLDNTRQIEYIWPPFGANIIIELWKNDKKLSNKQDNYFIRVLYLEKELELAQCNMDYDDKTKCNLNKFIELLDKSSVDEDSYKEMCNKNRYD